MLAAETICPIVCLYLINAKTAELIGSKSTNLNRKQKTDLSLLECENKDNLEGKRDAISTLKGYYYKMSSKTLLFWKLNIWDTLDLGYITFGKMPLGICL